MLLLLVFFYITSLVLCYPLNLWHNTEKYIFLILFNIIFSFSGSIFYWRKNLVHLGLKLEDREDPVTWSEEQVLEFVGSIPGCEQTVKAFQNQVGAFMYYY